MNTVKLFAITLALLVSSIAHAADSPEVFNDKLCMFMGIEAYNFQTVRQAGESEYQLRIDIARYSWQDELVLIPVGITRMRALVGSILDQLVVSDPFAVASPAQVRDETSQQCRDAPG